MVSVNVGKYNTFHRPNEAMLFDMVKTCLHLKNTVLFSTQKEFILHIIWTFYLFPKKLNF